MKGAQQNYTDKHLAQQCPQGRQLSRPPLSPEEINYDQQLFLPPYWRHLNCFGCNIQGVMYERSQVTAVSDMEALKRCTRSAVMGPI